MKKKIWVVSLISFFFGCSQAQVENFVRDPLKDPHYAHHQQAMEELEHAYLRKEISFPDYQEKRKELEDRYAHEVKARENKMHGNNF